MIAIGSDHGGYELKEHVKKHLEEKGIEVKDFGVFSEESVDYPDCARPVCEAVLNGEAERGILFCGTGIGISMAANKFNGIRAALCGDVFSAKMAKEHNNANVICLGGRVTGRELAFMIVDTFFDAEFQGGRHQTRIDKIHAIEKEA
ncbi:MAG: ribose 5-phosphate isomerase B [Clostridia bacterium]|nr:ribose 5-phosphate isomerase B [Clostridia bacterium]MBQ3462297.1 ribose 5-phosphate isomerase B [Clostridia bacterium]